MYSGLRSRQVSLRGCAIEVRLAGYRAYPVAATTDAKFVRERMPRSACFTLASHRQLGPVNRGTGSGRASACIP